MLPVEFLPDVDELPVSWMNRLALANGFIDVNDMLRSYRIIDGKKVVRHLDYFPKVLGLISDNTWSKVYFQSTSRMLKTSTTSFHTTMMNIYAYVQNV